MSTRNTRSKAPVKSTEEDQTSKTAASKYSLSPTTPNPRNLFILPKSLSPKGRILSLTNPRNSSKSRYFVCPESGFYEFTRVVSPKSNPQSCLITPALAATEGNTDVQSKGFISREAELFIATRIDELFLILQHLIPKTSTKSSPPPKRLFLAGEDYIDSFVAASPQIQGLLNDGSIRTRLEKRMAAVCDTVEAGDETMYRFSEDKLVQVILQKAENMVKSGLPTSMEEKLVRSALEMPLMSIIRVDISMKEQEDDKTNGGDKTESEVSKPSATSAETMDSQATTPSTETASSSFSEALTTATSVGADSASNLTTDKPSTKTPINAPEGIADLLRLRTALSYLCLNYLTPHLRNTVQQAIRDCPSPDFAPLDLHLAHLAKLRQDVIVARSLGEFTGKRSYADNDEENVERAEKKRKVEEEEKRKKAGISRGVANLKKADLTGMKKMSDFFKKK